MLVYYTSMVLKVIYILAGAAVNCESKQEYYITRIMSMEESVQQSIMQAIQSLDEATRGRGPFSLTDISDLSKIQKLNTELDKTTEAREILAQKCHELELQVECLAEEKSTLHTENQRLHNRLEEMAGSNITDVVDNSPFKNAELRKQVTELKEVLFKLEATRDDYRMKIVDYEKQIQTLQSRVEELQFDAGKAKQLKDEVDALTETAEKYQKMEQTLTSYKKKLEEYSDIKKQLKSLESKNLEYYQQNLNYEEEIKKNLSYKSQIDVYKKQLSGLNKNLDEEMQKVVKTEFEKQQLETKLSALQRERETLISERDSLKEINEELRCGTRPPGEIVGTVAKELAVPELRERLALLERENRSLRSATSSTADSAATAALLEEWNQQQEELRSQLKSSNQKILELEAKLEESNSSPGNDLKQKYVALQDACNAKDMELQNLHEQYKRNLDKARDAINSMETRTNTEDVLSRMNQTPNQNGVMKEAEARLLTTAFLNLGENCQRKAVDDRLALLSLGQGQTFLSRQRQPTPRKSLQHRLK